MDLFNRAKKEEMETERRGLEQQKELQRDAAVLGNSLGSDSLDLGMQTQNNDLIRWQQDFDSTWEELRHLLRREVLDDNQVWQKQTSTIPKHRSYIEVDEEGKETKKFRIDMVEQQLPPLANELGISEIIMTIRSVVNKGNINSNYDQDNVNYILKRSCKSVAEILCHSGEEKYNIEFADWGIIMTLIKNWIWGAPFRAFHDAERTHNRSIIRRVENYSENGAANTKKVGFFDF